jgi:hypothetical protein
VGGGGRGAQGGRDGKCPECRKPNMSQGLGIKRCVVKLRAQCVLHSLQLVTHFFKIKSVGQLTNSLLAKRVASSMRWEGGVNPPPPTPSLPS